jgi:hypothetical protein
MSGNDQLPGAILNAIADCLIPRCHGMPSASDVGVADLLLRKVNRYRPDLIAAISAILRDAGGIPAMDLIDRLERREPRRLQQLFEAIAGAYYLSPEVRRRIGYPGQEALTLPRDGIGVEDLVESRLGGEKTFRRTPGEDAS